MGESERVKGKLPSFYKESRNRIVHQETTKATEIDSTPNSTSLNFYMTLKNCFMEPKTDATEKLQARLSFKTN
jgi:hypothetical protein